MWATLALFSITQGGHLLWFCALHWSLLKNCISLPIHILLTIFPFDAFGYRISLLCWGCGVDFWRYFYVWIAALAKGLMHAWNFLGIQRRQSVQFPISNNTATLQIRVLEYTFIYFRTITPVPRILRWCSENWTLPKHFVKWSSPPAFLRSSCFSSPPP